MPDAVDAIVQQWGARLPDLDASPLEVFGRMERIVALADARLRPPFADAGLAPGEFNVLAAVRRSGRDGMRPGDLAAAMLVTAGAATKRIDRLVAAGLLEKRRVEVDGRERLVSLTDRGRELTDELIAAHMANESAMLEAMGPEKRTRLASLLAELLESVTSG